MLENFSSRLPPHFAQHQRFVADFHILEAGRAALENQNNNCRMWIKMSSTETEEKERAGVVPKTDCLYLNCYK